jgi:hypothetical protein
VSGRQWVYAGARAGHKPSAGEKAAVSAEFERLITEFLKPRFLPEVRPTSFNYPIDIIGKWHGNKYRLLQRFRSDSPDAIEPEFDAPFARVEYVSRDRFDLSYYRHTGEWFRLYRSISLAEALRLMESDGHFHPV